MGIHILVFCQKVVRVKFHNFHTVTIIPAGRTILDGERKNFPLQLRELSCLEQIGNFFFSLRRLNLLLILYRF